MLNDFLNSLQRDGAITEAVSLRSFAGILSDSVAFVTSRDSSTDWTSLISCELKFRNIRRSWCIDSASR